MKRLFSLFLCCLLLGCLLCSCQPRLSSDEDNLTLNYPGLTWGMSPQEVMDALYLTEDQVQKTAILSAFPILRAKNCSD